MTHQPTTGPLQGLRVLEFSGLGPAPFCSMLLSDMGADVVRIDRPDSMPYKPEDVEARGRQSLVLNLKDETDIGHARKLIEKCNILIEGFRPGVMERLGLGPEQALVLNPALIYGRMTGWGQTGPLSQKAGHDLNYLALSGALHAIGSEDKPAIPLNLVADFGGGALYLAMGVLAAWHHARSTGQGQVVDCAMTEGVISMLGMIYGDYAAGTWNDRREDNVIDGGAPFYNVYRCADGKWISVAAIEPQFYQALLQGLGMNDGLLGSQWHRDAWPQMKNTLQEVFVTRDRDDWCAVFSALDACIAPVLSLEETRHHPQHVARQAFVVRDGIAQPAPAPRFSATPGAIQGESVTSVEDVSELLRQWSLPA